MPELRELTYGPAGAVRVVLRSLIGAVSAAVLWLTVRDLGFQQRAEMG